MTSPTAWHDELWFDCHACDWGDCTGRRGCKGNELTARIAELEAALVACERCELGEPCQRHDQSARIAELEALLRRWERLWKGVYVTAVEEYDDDLLADTRAALSPPPETE